MAKKTDHSLFDAIHKQKNTNPFATAGKRGSTGFSGKTGTIAKSNIRKINKTCS